MTIISGKLQIWVRLPDQSQVAVEVASDSTVDDVMMDPQLVQYRQNHDLTFGTACLPRNAVLSDAGVCMESALDLTLKGLHWARIDPEDGLATAVFEDRKLAIHPGQEGSCILWIDETFSRGAHVSMELVLTFAACVRASSPFLRQIKFGFMSPSSFAGIQP